MNNELLIFYMLRQGCYNNFSLEYLSTDRLYNTERKERSVLFRSFIFLLLNFILLILKAHFLSFVNLIIFIDILYK